MEQPLLRLLIQEKLADGRLPSAPIPRAWSGSGTGHTCDGCGEPVTHTQTMVENLDAGSRAVRFHVACFHVWNVERQMAGHEPGARLPTRSAFRAPDARPNRPWAPRPPAARPTPSGDGIDHAVKVLVIDDQPLLRDVLAEFLELLGHEADQAAFSASGRVGLAYSADGKPLAWVQGRAGKYGQQWLIRPH